MLTAARDKDGRVPGDGLQKFRAPEFFFAVVRGGLSDDLSTLGHYGRLVFTQNAVGRTEFYVCKLTISLFIFNTLLA